VHRSKEKVQSGEGKKGKLKELEEGDLRKNSLKTTWLEGEGDNLQRRLLKGLDARRPGSPWHEKESQKKKNRPRKKSL